MKQLPTIQQEDSCGCGIRMTSALTMQDTASAALLAEERVSLFYKKGQLLFSKGCYPSGIFCVNTGKVKLVHEGSYGRQMIIRMYKEGDWLGYRALLSNERYNATAVALEDTQVCFFSRSLLLVLMENNVWLSLEFIRLLSTDLRRAENTLTSLMQQSARERIARVVLQMEAIYGRESDGVTIKVVLSRSDIASIAGTVPETTIRLLSDFKEAGLLSFSGRKIAILDEAKLRKIAG